MAQCRDLLAYPCLSRFCQLVLLFIQCKLGFLGAATRELVAFRVYISFGAQHQYTYASEPSQLARGDLGALRYAPGTVGKLTMSPFHRRIAGFVKLDTREMALVAIRRLPHCQAR